MAAFGFRCQAALDRIAMPGAKLLDTLCKEKEYIVWSASTAIPRPWIGVGRNKSQPAGVRDVSHV